MKKTALILTGKYGSSNINLENIMKNVVEPNNCDVFFYTFEDYYINNFHLIHIINHFKLDDEDINNIQHTFRDHLKVCKIEKTNKYDAEYEKIEPLITQKISFMEKYPDSGKIFYDSQNKKIKDFKRYVEQYFINKICFNILTEYEQQNNIQYDVIIRLRCDAFFYEPFIIPNLNNNTLMCCGDPLNEWMITSFFLGSRNTMQIVLQNILDEMFIEPINPTHIKNKEILFHEIQFGCAIKQLYIKHNFIIQFIPLMANVIKLSKDGISIHMGPYYTNKIISNNNYLKMISKYILNNNTELRSYIFITPAFWENCNEETKYKKIPLF